MRVSTFTAFLILASVVALAIATPSDATKTKKEKRLERMAKRKARRRRRRENRRNNKKKSFKGQNPPEEEEEEVKRYAAFLQNQIVPGCGLAGSPFNGDLPVDFYFPVDATDSDLADLKQAEFEFLSTKLDLSSVGILLLDGETSPIADGKFPLVVYEHGFGGYSTENLSVLAAIAKEGYIVIAPTHNGSGGVEVAQASELGIPPETLFQNVFHFRPHETKCVTDYFVDIASDDIDSDNIGVFGFSAGAISVLASSGGFVYENPVEADPRVKANVAMAPVVEGYPYLYESPISVPLFLISSEEDDTIPPSGVSQFWDTLEVEGSSWMKFFNVEHSGFSDVCTTAALVNNLDDAVPTKQFFLGLLSSYFVGPGAVDCSVTPYPGAIYTPAIIDFFDVFLKDQGDKDSLLSMLTDQYDTPEYDGILDVQMV